MRKLTNSEKRLSIALGLLLFLGLNAIAISLYNRKMDTLKQDVTNLANQQILAEVWLDERDLWHKRKEWLDANQPAFPQDGSEGSSLLELLQSSAAKNSLTIQKQSLMEPVTTPEYSESSVTLRIAGRLENLIRWMVTLQSPEDFHSISSFTLKSDKEPPNVICDLKVSRWYLPQ